MAPAPFLGVRDTELLAGVVVPAISIVAAVGVAAGFFFMQFQMEVRDKALRRIERLRRANHMPRLSASEVDLIENQFRAATKATYSNAVAILISTAICVMAAIWTSCDFPCITWPSPLGLSKLQMAYAIALASLAAVLLATHDILATSYTLVRLSHGRGT